MSLLRYALGFFGVLCGAGSAETLTIEHGGVGCVVAGKFPIITARLDPFGEVARARVYFRATGTPHWYFVWMRPDRGRFSGVLPKPTKALKTIDYYIEAVDLASAASRTADTRPEVVDPPGACRAGLAIAAAVSTATVVVGAAGGAPGIPSGFAAEGIVSAAGAPGTTAGPGTTGGSGTAGAAGTASAAGTGVSTAAVAAGVVGAGVAAVAVASGGGDTSAATAAGSWVGLSPDGMILQPPECVRAVDLILNLVQSGSSLTGTALTRTRELNPNRGAGCTDRVGASAPGSVSGTAGSNTVTFAGSFNLGDGEAQAINFTGTFTATRMSGTFMTVEIRPLTGIWSVNRQ